MNFMANSEDTDEVLVGDEIISLSTIQQPITDEDVSFHADILDSFYSSVRSSALQHVDSLKSRLHHERETQLQTQKDYYEDIVYTLQAALAQMTSKYEASEINLVKSKDSGLIQLDKFSSMYNIKYKSYISAFSVKQIFTTWKYSVLKRRKYKLLTSLTQLMLRKRRVSVIFHKMHKASMISHFTRKENDNNAQVGHLAKQTIEAYEAELFKMRQEVVDAHAVSRHEQLRRHQLEEDLRRMFLKNMTAMNMEALSLFSFPPEYKSNAAANESHASRIPSQVKRDLLTFVKGEVDDAPAPRDSPPIPSNMPEGINH